MTYESEYNKHARLTGEPTQGAFPGMRDTWHMGWATDSEGRWKEHSIAVVEQASYHAREHQWYDRVCSTGARAAIEVCNLTDKLEDAVCLGTTPGSAAEAPPRGHV